MSAGEARFSFRVCATILPLRMRNTRSARAAIAALCVTNTVSVCVARLTWSITSRMRLPVS